MAEAPEVAKLRLFLKLAAQIDRVEDLEPLPDLDFNIKCGNLLVGVRDKDDATDRIAAARSDGQLSLASVGRLDGVGGVANEMAVAYDLFVATQDTTDHQGASEAKRALIKRSAALRADCDDLLHGLREETAPLDQWVASHQPFHWFIEFPSVWRNGGFDVIIGNPPYIRTKKVTGYRWVGYKTATCPDLYAACVERASTLLNNNSRFAVIVMHSLCFSDRFDTLREHLSHLFSRLWYSSYSRIPGALFGGSVRVRNTIVVGCKTSEAEAPITFSTPIQRWTSEARECLFEKLDYVKVPARLMSYTFSRQWPAIGRTLASAYSRVCDNEPVETSLVKASEFPLYFKKVAQYSVTTYVERPPILDRDGNITVSPHDGVLYFRNAQDRDFAILALTGRWGYLWWMAYGDEFHVTRGTLAAFPGDMEQLTARVCTTSSPASGDMELEILLDLSRTLQSEMPRHLAWKANAGIQVGRYNMLKLRYITDRADWLLARAWGIEEAFEAAGNLRDRMIFGNKE